MIGDWVFDHFEKFFVAIDGPDAQLVKKLNYERLRLWRTKDYP